MKNIKIIYILCFITINGLTGCSSFGIDGIMQNSQKLEATQRMLLVTDKGVVRKIDSTGTGTSTIDKDSHSRVVCAEPSPDALIAAAATGNLAISPKGQELFNASSSYAEAVGELGERTAVIQMLRDSLYRSCEAYMNGLLSEKDYKNQVLIYFDDFALTLLAIESLTRQPRAPTIVQTEASIDKTSQDEKPKQISKGTSQTPSVQVTDNNRALVAQTVKEIVKNYGEHQLMFSLYEKLTSPENNKKPITTNDQNKDQQKPTPINEDDPLFKMLKNMMTKKGLIDEDEGKKSNTNK